MKQDETNDPGKELQDKAVDLIGQALVDVVKNPAFWKITMLAS